MDIRYLMSFSLLLCFLTGCAEEAPAPIAARDSEFTEDKARAEGLLKWMGLDPHGFGEMYLNLDAFAMEVATGNVIRLTNSVGSERDPMLSPDRRHLVFASQDVIVRELESGDQRRITSDLSCRLPRWNREGTEIAFLGTALRRRDGKPAIPAEQYIKSGQYLNETDLYLVGSDGQYLRNVTNTDGVIERSYDWAHDGSSIVCLADQEDGTSILSIFSTTDKDTLTVPLRLRDDVVPIDVAWSHVSSVVTILAISGLQSEFFDIDINTLEITSLGSVTGYSGIDFDRSADKGQFAVVAHRSDRYKVENLLSENLPPILVYGQAPIWSHDATYITYESKELPIGLLEGLKEGKVVKSSDQLLVIKEGGGQELGTDHFHEYYPVVREVFDPQTGQSKLVNMSKSEAIELLQSTKSLRGTLSDIHEWNWEK